MPAPLFHTEVAMLTLPPDRQRTWSEYEVEPEADPVAISGTVEQRAALIEEAKQIGKVFLLEPAPETFTTEKDYHDALTDVYIFSEALREAGVDVSMLDSDNSQDMRLTSDMRRLSFSNKVQVYLFQFRKFQRELEEPLVEPTQPTRTRKL